MDRQHICIGLCNWILQFVQTLSNEERQKYRDHHRNLVQLMEPLVQNHTNITFMKSISQRLDLHCQLYQLSGNFRENTTAFQITTCLNMLNLAHDSLFPNSKADVLREVYSLARDLNLR